MENNKENIVVLGIGGVVLVDGIIEVFDYLSKEFDVSYELIINKYRELREDLWTGNISTEDFWLLLCEDAEIDNIDPYFLDELLITFSIPLVDQSLLDNMSCKVIFLTNHRNEWLYSALGNAGLDIDKADIFCSQDMKALKPNKESYETINSLFSEHHNIIFVDDKVINFTIPLEMGWAVIKADIDWKKKLLSSLKSS